MKFLQGYRTIIFNVIMGALMLVRALNPDAELPDEEQVNALVDHADALLTVVWGVGNLVLRAVTTSPIFKKKEQ